MASQSPSSRFSCVLQFRSPPWRESGPHITYDEVFKHLASTGKGRFIRPEASMSIASDGYLPKSWNVLTELDILPPAVKNQGTFLFHAIAAILAKANGAGDPATRADQEQAVAVGDNANGNEVVKDNNTTSGEPVQGYGMHSAGTTAAAKQTIINIKEGFELHLEESTLVAKRHHKTESGEDHGNDSGTSIVSNIHATDAKRDSLDVGAGAVLEGNSDVAAVRSTTPSDSPPSRRFAKINRTTNPNTSSGISTGTTNTTVKNNTTTAAPSTTAAQAPNPITKPSPNSAPRANLVPAQNFLFNSTSIPHATAYLKLTEANFISPWQLPPLGSSLFLTVHGDTHTTALAGDESLDAKCASILCSFICLGTLPGTEALKIIHSFLHLGPKFTPDAQYVTTVQVIRGDTIIIPPLVLYRLEYQTNTLTATGIFMFRSNLRLSMESWKWDALSLLRRGYVLSLELLDVVMSEVCRDPAGTGWDGARVAARERLEKEALMDAYTVVKDQLLEEEKRRNLELQLEMESYERARDVVRNDKWRLLI